MKVTPNRLRRVMNLWPPFLFNAIRVQEVAADWRSARVVLRKRWYNSNYVGTHFGGNLFAMTDPFWMLLLIQLLGRDYFVWDKAAEIEFVAPGRSDVFTTFTIDDAMLETIRAATRNGDKYLHWFDNEVRGTDGELVARVRKQVYFRRKPARRPESATTP